MFCHSYTWAQVVGAGCCSPRSFQGGSCRGREVGVVENDDVLSGGMGESAKMRFSLGQCMFLPDLEGREYRPIHENHLFLMVYIGQKCCFAQSFSGPSSFCKVVLLAPPSMAGPPHPPWEGVPCPLCFYFKKSRPTNKHWQCPAQAPRE